MRNRTTFDKIGYWILGMAWLTAAACALPQGPAVVGYTSALLLMGSVLFMVVWMFIGWLIGRRR